MTEEVLSAEGEVLRECSVPSAPAAAPAPSTEHPLSTQNSAPSTVPYDAVVIGAGPAGALAAILLARRNLNVLLVDRAQSWPRDKPCGGCLDPQAHAILRHHRLDHLLAQTHAISRTVLHHRGKTINAQVAHALAISRPVFDAALVQEFQRAGGTFLHATSATIPLAPEDNLPRGTGILPVSRDVHLTHDNTAQTLRAKLILVADGLAGTSLAQHPWAEWHIAPDAHLGIAATLPDHAHLADPHTIHMHAAPDGYVGLVRLPGENGAHLLHLGAALSPQACRTHGGPANIIRRILRSSANLTLPTDLPLKGTPLLTRHRSQLGSHRILTLGDACAYVEPFTGQGIGWALRSSHEAIQLLTPFNLAVWPTGLSQAWTRRYAKVISPQHRPCRAVRALLRSDALSSLAGSLIEALPELPRRITSLQALHM